jgi:hypothetical protein
MATLVRPRFRFDAERRFFIGMAAWILITVFIGFAPTYFLLPWLQGVTVRGQAPGAGLTPLVHVHATLFSAWVILFGVQAFLIAGRRFTVHRALGGAAVVLALLVLVVGVWTSIYSARLGNTPPGWANAEAFLAVPLTGMALFAGFIAAGFAWRRRPDYHKRLMLLGTVAMLVPALARIMRMADWPILPPGVWGAMIVLNIYLAALIVFDLRQRGHVHPVTMWGVGLHLLSWPGRLYVGYTEPWQAFARWLLN